MKPARHYKLNQICIPAKGLHSKLEVDWKRNTKYIASVWDKEI